MHQNLRDDNKREHGKAGEESGICGSTLDVNE